MHGIPGSRKLKDGDIVSLDLGCVVDGFFGDSARTVAVGRVSPEAARLIRVTEESLHAGIAQLPSGQAGGRHRPRRAEHAEANGYSVVREFVGHGIGTSLHEDPQVPNYGPPGRRERLVPGMCLAIEPMVNLGGRGRARAGGRVDGRHRRTASCPRTSSCRWRSPSTVPGSSRSRIRTRRRAHA